MAVLSIISAALLFLAIPTGLWPYSYYILLRWLICVSAILHASFFNSTKNKYWPWIFSGIAALFNPFIPFYLNKSSWVLLDFIAAIMFLFSMKRE
jgi:hypothetical protein